MLSPPSTPISITANDIGQLDETGMVDLMERLLCFEAGRNGIAQNCVSVTSNTRAKDGGIDGRVHWAGGVERTNYFTCRDSAFQCKAASMGASACGAELKSKNGKTLKPMIYELLKDGGTYTIFVNQKITDEGKRERCQAMLETANNFGLNEISADSFSVLDSDQIANWANKSVAIPRIVLDRLGKPVPLSVISWGHWSEILPSSAKFVSDGTRNGLIDQLQQSATLDQEVVRVIGFSGMGKTRLVHHAIATAADATYIKSRCIYFDANEYTADFMGYIQSWVHDGRDALLVVDNCSIDLHDRIASEVKRPNSQLALFSMHSESDRGDPCKLIGLDRLERDSIKKIYVEKLGNKIDALDRLADLADGFPKMAVMVADQVAEGRAELGKLDDDKFAKTMLWGSSPPISEEEHALSAISVFHRVGFSDEAASELEWVATNLAHMDYDRLFALVRKFEKRGVVDCVGRYIQISPKPMAVRLASLWWERTPPTSQQSFIASSLPGGLQENLCKQVEYLSFHPTVKELTKELCGDSGPFAKADVILSARGSRLIRSFAKVDAYAVASAISRSFHDLCDEQVLTLNPDARRNLIYALEVAAFERNCFRFVADSLALLAVNETENWSNNATGIFTQLFRPFLSGNAADAEQRFSYLDRLTEKGGRDFDDLVVRALSEAISFRNSGRLLGPEQRGAADVREEWAPRDTGETVDYFTAAICRLGHYLDSSSDIGNRARSAITTNLRYFIHGPKRLLVVLTEAIELGLRGVQGGAWPELSGKLRDVLNYESSALDDETALKEFNRWRSLASPENVQGKLKVIVSEARHDLSRNSAGEIEDIAKIRAKEFAKEFKLRDLKKKSTAASLISGAQTYAYEFAKALELHDSGDLEKIVRIYMKELASIKEPNPSFVFGILESIHSKDKKSWECLIDEAYCVDGLEGFFPSFISTGRISEGHLAKVLRLARAGSLESWNLKVLSSGRIMNISKPAGFSDFLLELSEISSQFAWEALEILEMYRFGLEGDEFEFSGTLSQLVLKVCLTGDDSRHMGWHHWKEGCLYLLAHPQPTFQNRLVETILGQAKHGIPSGSAEGYVDPVLESIIESDPVFFMQRLTEQVASSNSLERYRLGLLLKGRAMFSRATFGPLDRIPIAVIEKFVYEADSELLVFLVGTLSPLRAAPNEAGDGRSDDPKLFVSPAVKLILKQAGDDARVLDHFSASIGSFSWAGSLVPALQQEMDALIDLKRDASPELLGWIDARLEYLSNRIQLERKRDAEQGRK